ncbi:MAG: hypothetical protein ACRD0G_17425, partial [Acidimicrobiales bacterium]
MRTGTQRHRVATPVVVGVADVVQRPGEGAPLDPIGLAALAARQAAGDAGAPSLLDDLDELDVVNVVGWAYDDPAGRLAATLGSRPAHASHSDVGGHQPSRLLDA